MRKTIYLMRHGQTLFNQQHRIQGWCDSPLTEKGIYQAQCAREYFQKECISFDKLFASTQERACDTLEIVSKSSDYTRLKGVKEMSFGIFEGAPEYLHIHRREGAHSFEDVYVPYGGESIEAVGNRMVKTLTNILVSEEGENFLVVSHGAAMWAFFLNLALPTHPKVIFSNVSIFQYEYENGLFTLEKVIDPVENVIYETCDQ